MPPSTATAPLPTQSIPPVPRENPPAAHSPFKIVGIGEVLWDVLPTGRKLGGAPANFTCHARALGADARVVSRVGDDALGREIIERLEFLGVPTYCISIDPLHPTGTVTVTLSRDGQPSFVIREGAAWDHLEVDQALTLTVAGADAVCFGTLGQRFEPSRSTIRHLVRQTPDHAVRVFDVNLRQHFYSRALIEESLACANVLKLNDAELPVVCGLLGVYGSPKQQLAKLQEKYRLRLIACTCGEKGSVLHDGADWCEFPGIQTRVKDAVGAGDSFTAAITLGLLAGCNIEHISRVANEVAAYVCSCDGATPPMPPHLRDYFESAQVSPSLNPS